MNRIDATARAYNTQAEIIPGAAHKGVAIGAVKKHISNILGNVGIASQAQAMVKARQLGLMLTVLQCFF